MNIDKNKTGEMKERLIIRNTADLIGGKPIAVRLQSTSGVNALHPKLITNLNPLTEVNPMSMSIHISASICNKSQLAMWIHYWHTQAQIWIPIAMTDG
jgi:hypothetical protein